MGQEIERQGHDGVDLEQVGGRPDRAAPPSIGEDGHAHGRGRQHGGGGQPAAEGGGEGQPQEGAPGDDEGVGAGDPLDFSHRESEGGPEVDEGEQDRHQAEREGASVGPVHDDPGGQVRPDGVDRGKAEVEGGELLAAAPDDPQESDRQEGDADGSQDRQEPLGGQGRGRVILAGGDGGEPHPPEKEHGQRDEEHGPAKPTAALQGPRVVPQEVGRKEDHEKVREERIGVVDGRAGQAHPKGTDRHRQKNREPAADERQGGAGGHQRPVGGNEGERPEAGVGLDHDARHQDRPAGDEHRGQGTAPAILVPSGHHEGRGVAHAEPHAEERVDDAVVGDGPQDQCDHHQEAECRQAGKERRPARPVDHFVGEAVGFSCGRFLRRLPRSRRKGRRKDRLLAGGGCVCRSTLRGGCRPTPLELGDPPAQALYMLVQPVNLLLDRSGFDCACMNLRGSAADVLCGREENLHPITRF